ncbi:hypothetical protein GCM10009021_30000 [Halarchaeum nitratireducens]|uniref:Uncharacterized protein n=1 Tax=Halarchaeum nitratireducens TaxID=489913 RepID=A0A830GFG2_9EURY|nr:hypothetical protein GCM10009021_30000 [Halarchaeum nitratireducens]
MGESISVAARVADDEVIRDRVNRRTALRDDHEVSRWIASLNLASGSNVFVDLVDVVGVTDHADLWFVLEETLDVPIKVRIAKVVIQHPDW